MIELIGWGPFLLIILALAVLFFAWRLDWGLYCLTAVSFLIEWQIDFSQFQSLRHYPYLSSINAPLVDLLALLLLVSLFLAVLWRLLKIKKTVQPVLWPAIFLYGLFVVVAVFSLLANQHSYLFAGSKFLFRPLLFIFFAYLLFPLLVLNQSKVLEKVFKIWAIIGALSAVYGLFSLIIVPQGSWPRVVPFALAGFAPYGYNHNVLAQALVVVLPVVW